MVEPKHNVPVIIEIGTGDGDGLICVVGKDSKRTSGVESHASDSTRINIVLVENALNRRADASPDVVG